MATDFSAELREKNLPGSRLTIRPDLGFAVAGNGRVDRQQDCRFSDVGYSSSAVLTATKEGIESHRAAVRRIPEYYASVFYIFKKIRRAERFGIPVRLSEAEKRFSRAERWFCGFVALFLFRMIWCVFVCLGSEEWRCVLFYFFLGWISCCFMDR